MDFSIDSVILIGFLCMNLLIGLVYSGKVKNIKDLALGSNKFSTGAMTATIAATFIGGGSFSIWTSGVYKTGLYYMLLGICDVFTFYIICYIIAPRCGEFIGKISIAEAMGEIYGPVIRATTALAGLFRTAGAIAMQFKVAAIVLSYAFGNFGDKLMIIAALIVITYSAIGGIRAVIMTDIMQLLTFSVFIPILAFIIWSNLDNPSSVVTTLYSNNLFDYKQVFNFSSYHEIINFILIIIVFLSPHLDPAMFQRIAIAKDVKQIKKSFFWAGFCVLLITFLTYWIAILLLTKTTQLDSEKLVPYLLEHYTYPGLKGLILAGIIAILISTADSHLNAASVLFSHDLIKFLGVKRSAKTEVLISRVALLIVGGIAMILAISVKDMLKLILFVASFYGPVVTVPLYLAIAGFRSSVKPILYGMVTGVLTSLFFHIYNVPFDSTVPAMLANIFVVFCAHYMLKGAGGWVGIKDQASLEELRYERKVFISQFTSCINNFNLMSFFKSNTPKNDSTYFSFGLFSMVSMFCVMHSIPKDILTHYASLSNFIFNTVLFIAAIFMSYPAWPDRFKSQNGITIVWNIGTFYVMIFAISLLVIMSNFGQLPMMIFMINLIIMSALMRWQPAVLMLIVGGYGAITFFKWYVGVSALPESDIALQFKFIYAVLLITSTLILFLKPKQEYLEATEHKVEELEIEAEHLIHEVTGLNGQVIGLHSEVIDLKDQVTHFSERVSEHQKEIARLGATAQKILNNVNHELRLPIGNVVNFSDMLNETLGKSDNKLVKELSKEVYDNSNRVSTMILNMLDLATLEVRKVDLQKTTINFSELVMDRVKTCRKIYLRDKKIDFELKIKPEIMIAVDPNYIRQTVDNLVINAINFSQNGLIKVIVTKERKQVTFTIIDQGKGIPPEELSDIFTPFKMGSNTESKAEGRGIGLALCKSAVEAHGGNIMAESNGEVGATLRFVLLL